VSVSIGLTMRVTKDPKTEERRDAIDQNWFKFLEFCELKPFLLPNNQYVFDALEKKFINGIILTGGNSLSHLNGDAPERDAFEYYLLRYAIFNKIPVLGVCRGMQVIQNFFNVTLEQVSNHVATHHNVFYNRKTYLVNSFHRYGAYSSVKELQIIGKAEDGLVEAIQHVTLPLKAIMWHPERESVFKEFDKKIFQNHFLNSL
jgi:putative glutamine amidotransferase